jgi:2-amino-4-hydroxy-6-hydroxymethyldihydropteridine diphosphokinase
MKIDQHIVYLSIGSNIGDKKKNLNDATAILNCHDKIDVVEVSSFYKTEPQNFTDQDWFVNAALKIRTVLTPEDLIAVIKTLEKDLDEDGKPFRFGPRIIDIDIIYYDNLVLKNKHLDIGAHKIHPVLTLRSDDLLKKIEKQETQKVILLDKEA